MFPCKVLLCEGCLYEGDEKKSQVWNTRSLRFLGQVVHNNLQRSIQIKRQGGGAHLIFPPRRLYANSSLTLEKKRGENITETNVRTFSLFVSYLTYFLLIP